MKTMLLQRPKPFEDESLESYLIRIANRNSYQDVDRFLSALCSGQPPFIRYLKTQWLSFECFYLRSKFKMETCIKFKIGFCRLN